MSVLDRVEKIQSFVSNLIASQKSRRDFRSLKERSTTQSTNPSNDGHRMFYFLPVRLGLPAVQLTQCLPVGKNEDRFHFNKKGKDNLKCK